MAVKKGRRRKGVGSALIDFIKEISAGMNLSELVLHSQASAIPFYEKRGFSGIGKPFKEARIPHRKMTFRY
jgi:predicted GNAT family N-acyltransferase